MNVYKWNEMKRAEKERLLRHSETDIQQFVEQVKPIVNDVHKNNNATIVRWTKKFDNVSLTSAKFKATPAEFTTAKKQLSTPLRNAIERAASNVHKYHKKQIPQNLWLTPMEPNVYTGEKITPVTSCDLYVPHGKGSFPSIMIMLSAPTMIADVKRIVTVTPPGPNGEMDTATLITAEAYNMKDIYQIDSVQTIASLTYNTTKIPKINKIIGPSSNYITTTKRILYGIVNVELPADPSESIILANEKADPELMALDLLIEQEHGPDSTALLITHSEELIKKVVARVPALIHRLPKKRREFIKKDFSNFDGAVLTHNLDQSLDFVNQFAPEHLEVLITQPFETLDKLKNAGEILLGPNTPITLNNFNLGIDAILPTGGFAKSFSSISVYDFLKRSSIGYVTPQGFKSLTPSTEMLTRYKGFPTHAQTVAEHRKQLKKKA